MAEGEESALGEKGPCGWPQGCDRRVVLPICCSVMIWGP